MGILGSFGTDALASIPGILGGINSGIDQNRMAMMGMGLGLMGGGGSAASMKAAMEGLTSGSRADYLRIHEENARRQKEQEHARQTAMAKALGLPEVFAGSSVVDKVAANKYAPDTTGRAPTALEQLRALMTPEQFKSYMDKQAGIKPAEPETWEPKTIETGGGKATVWQSSRGNVSSRPPAGINLGELAVASDVPAAVKTKAVEVERAASNLQGALDDHVKLVEEHGTGYAPGGEKTSLGTSFTDLQMQMKNLYDLGAITGPDMAILQKMMPDPNFSWTNPQAGYKIEERTKAAKTQIEKILTRARDNAKASLGGPRDAPPSGPDAAGNKFPDGTQIRNAAGVSLIRRNGQWVDPMTGRPVQQ